MAAKNQNTVVTATQKTEPGAKKDALATALAQIEKQFGKGAVMKLGDNAAMQVEAISTGSLGLDMALGGLWGAMVAGSLWFEGEWSQKLFWWSNFYPPYYLAASLWLHWKRENGGSQEVERSKNSA